MYVNFEKIFIKNLAIAVILTLFSSISDLSMKICPIRRPPPPLHYEKWKSIFGLNHGKKRLKVSFALWHVWILTLRLFWAIFYLSMTIQECVTGRKCVKNRPKICRFLPLSLQQIGQSGSGKKRVSPPTSLRLVETSTNLVEISTSSVETSTSSTETINLSLSIPIISF